MELLSERNREPAYLSKIKPLQDWNQKEHQNLCLNQIFLLKWQFEYFPLQNKTFIDLLAQGL